MLLSNYTYGCESGFDMHEEMRSSECACTVATIVIH